MLVLTRKIGEKVIIPNDRIVIHVLEIQGERVRLGFEAPRTTEIRREELWCRLVREEATVEEAADVQGTHS
jgi:carbon storage regulator